MAKQSYVKLLKEAITDWDTSKQVDIKGPFLDPIISYKGDGELPTHKDAASILERYYFGETDSTVMVEAEENEIDEVPPTEDSGVEKEKDQIEKEITEQEEQEKEDEKDEEKEEDENKEEDKNEDKPAEITEQLENAIIEKLIEEMELQEEEVPGDKGEGTQAAGTGDAEEQLPDRKDMTNEEGDKEEVEEAFKIFKEQIEAEDKPEDEKEGDRKSVV